MKYLHIVRSNITDVFGNPPKFKEKGFDTDLFPLHRFQGFKNVTQDGVDFIIMVSLFPIKDEAKVQSLLAGWQATLSATSIDADMAEIVDDAVDDIQAIKDGCDANLE